MKKEHLSSNSSQEVSDPENLRFKNSANNPQVPLISESLGHGSRCAVGGHARSSSLASPSGDVPKERLRR
jgi:hypothetical protein